MAEAANTNKASDNNFKFGTAPIELTLNAVNESGVTSWGGDPIPETKWDVVTNPDGSVKTFIKTTGAVGGVYIHSDLGVTKLYRKFIESISTDKRAKFFTGPLVGETGKESPSLYFTGLPFGIKENKLVLSSDF